MRSTALACLCEHCFRSAGQRLPRATPKMRLIRTASLKLACNADEAGPSVPQTTRHKQDIEKLMSDGVARNATAIAKAIKLRSEHASRHVHNYCNTLVADNKLEKLQGPMRLADGKAEWTKWVKVRTCS